MTKPKVKKNTTREKRISMEIVVDANGPKEQAMGWHYYLEEKLQFPFSALCKAKRPISPLHVDDEVEVLGMAPEDECEKEMFVTIHWEKDGLAVPLSQLNPIRATDQQTKEAIEDWHYWVEIGYDFG